MKSKVKEKKQTDKTEGPDEQKALEKLKWFTAPVPETKQLSPAPVKQIIKQAFILWYNKSAKKPEDVVAPDMSDNIGELFYNLLSKGTGYQDWGASLYKYATFMMELLGLLAKPGVLDQLPEYRRSDAGELLNGLHEFFTAMDYEGNFPFLDTAFCDYADQEQLERLANYYDFTKRYEGNYHNHFFDTAYVVSNDQNRQALYNQLFKKQE